MTSLPFISKSKSSGLQFFGLGYFFPAILAVAGLLVGVVRADIEKREQYHVAQQVKAAEQLARVAASLETNIRGNVNLIYGLIAAIAANPNMNQPQFTALSERVFGVPSQLRNVVAAKDLVVGLVYPEEANKKALGLDYRTNELQRDAVMRAVERRTLVITGPVNLVQGGQGLIARYPVFSLANGRFWGVVSAVIDLDRLYADSNVNTQRQALDIAISQRPIPAERDIFLGTGTIFSQDPVKSRIELGYDTWYLAAVPKDGWQGSPPDMFGFRITALLIAFCIAAPLFWAGLLMKQRHGNILTLQQREEQLETLSQRLELALQASGVGVWEYEPSTDTLIWDQRMRELYDAPDRDVREYVDWRDALHPDDLEAAEACFRKALKDETSYRTEFRVVSRSGEIRHIRAHGATYRTAGGVKRVVGANWDVTRDVTLHSELRQAQTKAELQNDELRSARRTLEHQSLHDALTGLPNRRFLDQFMTAGENQAAGHRLAFIHIDLDRFKEVNDTLGHAAGDAVLKAATSRLLELIDHDEFASRIGGDEFVVVTGGAEPQRRAEYLAQSIVNTLARPIDIDGHECRIGCSAGIACQTAAGEELSQLLINADIALYEAKKRGRNRVEVFSKELRSAVVLRKRMSDEFLSALEGDQIIPFFQPQFDAHSLAIVGVEALARWQHPKRGLLAPDSFLAIAESLHRSADIDAIILEKALFQSARWNALGLDIPHLSVNISAQRLKDERLFKRLAELPIAPGTLSFELLESISFEDQDKDLRSAILDLKALGIDIEIDDFGTGHASIVSLLELGPKRLKIDRKLIAPLEAAGSQRRLVASIIEIGRSQGIEIVAEGVETAAHVDILRSLGCQTLQGYVFAKPMPANEFITFATDWRAGNHTWFAPSAALVR
ncbi:bifunctional diguanylate cyclase/phosphodiesterase [Neorhizobium galegae]|uniref:bifunctional diguanylate cyclase/phosphodiesterase n=1 Tax=Neorhizobium galegae TaxID=399 RepID=UPI000621F9AB|nr:EAL domain-containing protein [Neorhizobium galegae]KAB1124550.1 EAL domain-containing protein [Neorhizobium galegae]MCQ1810401.1 EAL domain-containing protein [Neorhizobium galegae]CDZ62858.1 Diguanylate cyclase/phosphodiesterase with PAS/PAC and Chase sensor(S) [Neorhizobium galegae bv. orientalis]